MSVSRRAGPPHCGHSVATQSSAAASGLRPLGAKSSTSGSSTGSWSSGNRHDAALLAIDDRDRAAPVALPRDQPVAEAIVDGWLAEALLLEPAGDLLDRLVGAHPGELTRFDEHLVLGVFDVGGVLGDVAAGRLDDAPDRQVERGGELVVALVVGGHGHHRAGPVLHQHVVGDEDRDLLAVDGVGDRATERDAGLLAVLGASLLGRLAQRLVDVVAHRALGVGAGDQPLDRRMLGREDEEGGAEQRVGAGREDGEVDAQLLAAEDDLGALRATDPVALHRLHVLGPLDRLEVVEQPVGVVGDAEEPLLELAHLDLGPAALAATVDDLLVGEHGRVLGAPLDRRLLAIREAALEQLQKDPLGPAVVGRLCGGELAAPVDRDPPTAELALEGGDRGCGRVAWMLAGLDRVVLGREAERVVAHRMDDPKAVAPLVVGDCVAYRVDLEVADVRLAGGVGQHLEHVGLRLRPVEAGLAGVGDLPGAL